MRLTRQIAASGVSFLVLLGGMVLTPGSAPAAPPKEMQELQRDVAELQDQIKQLQKDSDAKLTALQDQLNRVLEMTTKANNGVVSLNSGISQTLQAELRSIREQLNSVTGLSVKVDGASSDVATLVTIVQGLVSTVNRQQSTLNDINNQLKLMSAPQAAPPGTAPPVNAPGPSAQELFNSAVKDQNGGKPDLALTEYAEFLRLYPHDPSAARAQYYIGEIHYGTGKASDAVSDFDAVIEKYGDDMEIAPSAYYMKGMALEKANKPKDAIATYRDVKKKFPGTPDAASADKRLTALGASTPAAPARSRKKG